jgi:hypothetical protein
MSRPDFVRGGRPRLPRLLQVYRVLAVDVALSGVEGRVSCMADVLSVASGSNPQQAVRPDAIIMLRQDRQVTRLWHGTCRNGQLNSNEYFYSPSSLSIFSTLFSCLPPSNGVDKKVETI